MIPTENLQLIIMASQLCVLENEMEDRKDSIRELLRRGYTKDSPEINAVKAELLALYEAYRSQEADYLELERSLKR